MQQGSDAGRAHRPAGQCARQPQAPRPQDSSTAVHFRENAVHFHEHAQGKLRLQHHNILGGQCVTGFCYNSRTVGGVEVVDAPRQNSDQSNCEIP